MPNTTRRPKVFITNDPGSLDFSQAESFGDVIRLTSGTVDPFRPHLAQEQINAMLSSMGYDADVDYIVPAGATLTVGFAFAWLALYAENKNEVEPSFLPSIESLQPLDKVAVKLLLFDSKKRQYMVRTVSL